MKEKHYSSLSMSIRHSEKSSRYGETTNGYDERKYSKHRKPVRDDKACERRKGHSNSDSRSRSSSRDSETKEELQKLKMEIRKGKNDYSRGDKWEDKSEARTNNTVRVKDEPLSDDDELDFRNRRGHRHGHGNVDKFKPKRSRWGGNEEDDASAASTKRFREPEGEGEGEPRWGKTGDNGASGSKKKPIVNVAKPDFGLSGKLAEETNTYNGVVIKYSEPPEARKPKRRWRLYPFKGDEGLPTLYIHRQSAYLIGRDRKVADLPIDHPSCSKQHAALQYRLVPFERADGRTGKRICPYIIDLESANGTFVNNVKIEAKKYVQLLEKDVIKFAFSSREYVLLHEHSKDSDEDDDV